MHVKLNHSFIRDNNYLNITGMSYQRYSEDVWSTVWVVIVQQRTCTIASFPTTALCEAPRKRVGAV